MSDDSEKYDLFLYPFYILAGLILMPVLVVVGIIRMIKNETNKNKEKKK